MDAGVSISWAPDPSGSIEHGMRHHQREEAEFRARLDAAAPAIEVLFDELESAGRTFVPPTDPRFPGAGQQAASRGLPLVELRLCCEPALGEDELQALLARVVGFLEAAEAPPPTPSPPRADGPDTEPASPLTPIPVKPWWKFW
jgi:hypothetical protein